MPSGRLAHPASWNVPDRAPSMGMSEPQINVNSGVSFLFFLGALDGSLGDANSGGAYADRGVRGQIRSGVGT
eukprot:8048909-Lingulodinium_polyedra.AAC.1